MAATTLLYMSEEECFWLITTICEDLVPDYYSRGLQLMGSIVDLQILGLLTKKYLPDVYFHLQKVVHHVIFDFSVRWEYQ